ncbi:MAG: tRNA-dihydrouridine synthase family protein [Deltaproteobacteria bacterium]|nr:tRNA-dihydrouridine synthase family protein [Deltaproteobacteria bacterium]MBN2671378.1 tRNA-dihydrouridine synthase family protein [Deltaproteobacteria bacterium]
MTCAAPLYLAPIRGITDSVFRNAYAQCFTGIDSAVAPFVKTVNERLEPSQLRDLLPDVNSAMKVVPQILTRNAAGFADGAARLADLGYAEVNWNLGCPAPTTAGRGLGAGLLPNVDEIDAFLNTACRRISIPISVKARLGYEHPDELFRLVPILNRYPLCRVIIHPRIAPQQYDGDVDVVRFSQCAAALRTKVVYNGDITDVTGFNTIRSQFPDVSGWMLGRGVIANPFLPARILSSAADTGNSATDNATLQQFHTLLYEGYRARFSGPRHVITRMYGIWTYLIHTLGLPPGALKHLKKAKNFSDYQSAVASLLSKSMI